MDLKAYLQTQSSLCEFETAQHQKEVFEMLHAHPMEIAGIRLVYERTPDFNKLLVMQGSSWTTILGKDQERIMGLFSVSVSNKYILGEKHFVGYIGDFRTDGTSRSARTWRKTYAEILKAISESPHLQLPEYFLTAILADNKMAIRNLVDLKKDYGFYYHFLRKVSMVNVYGRVPFKKSANKYKARFATAKDEENLRQFLDKHERQKSFGSVLDTSQDSEWARRKRLWPDFKIEKFVLVENENKELLAATLPWSPSSAKRMRVTAAPSLVKGAFRVLKFLGYNMPRIGQSIETCYLTHLNIATKATPSIIVSEILHFLIDQSFLQSHHMLSFANWWDIRPAGFITQNVPVNLYVVSTDKNKRFDHIKTTEIGFEMGLV